MYTTGPTLDEDAVRRLAGEAAVAAARRAFADQGKVLLDEMQAEVRRSLGKAILDLSAAWGEQGGIVPEDVLREMVRVVRAEVAETGGGTGTSRETLLEAVRTEVARALRQAQGEAVASLPRPELAEGAAPAAPAPSSVAPAGPDEARVRAIVAEAVQALPEGLTESSARAIAEEAAAAAVAAIPEPPPAPPPPPPPYAGPAGPDEAAVRRIAREEALKQAESLRAAVGSGPSASLGAAEVLGMIRRAIEDSERGRPTTVSRDEVRKAAEEAATRAARAAVPPPAPAKLDEGRIRAIAAEVVREAGAATPPSAPAGPSAEEVREIVVREIAAAEERRPPSLSAAELRRIAEETAVRAARAAAPPPPSPAPPPAPPKFDEARARAIALEVARQVAESRPAAETGPSEGDVLALVRRERAESEKRRPTPVPPEEIRRLAQEAAATLVRAAVAALRNDIVTEARVRELIPDLARAAAAEAVASKSLKIDAALIQKLLAQEVAKVAKR